ncbi:hypothetical protein CWE08_08280 [Aliidiomarina iranensis]|uniref:Porin domain-containing protein n=1 Tax=Aliidiomarina iranensis TaxID=1434071 RepID=A0A432VVH5_9GAMM|nr:porin [Aliidiomarina iranensis]RUO20451.1 hypothetical protein CWE08_08280 [Aliidiomarina iranensis]
MTFQKPSFRPSLVLTVLASLSFSAYGNTNPAPEIDFYGRLHVSGDYLNDGDDGGLNVSSNSSRVGFKVNYQLSSDLELLGQIERGVNVSDGSSTFSARNSFIGLRGKWGTVRAGYYDSPTKRVINAVEQFRDQVGDGRNLARGGEMNFDRRFKSGVHYTSPTKYNLTWMAHYGTSEESGANTNTDTDAFSTSLTYKMNEWQAMIGFEQQDRADLETLEATRIALIREQGAWTNALFYQHASGMDTGTIETLGITGAYALDAEYSLRAQVYFRDVNDSDDMDAMMISLGISRELDTGVTLYASAAHTNNDELGTANVASSGRGKSLSVPTGNDPFAISLGLLWNF